MPKTGKFPRILIIGAGPTGLGAAYRLHELGHENFLVLEKNSYPGGLAASFVDEKGFTWDIGGHVQFSHYEYFDRVMDRALGDAWVHHTRQSHVWISGHFVPYPFQYNFRYLPKDQVWECVRGLLEVCRNGVRDVSNFRDWIVGTFGRGLAEVFFFPYNFKVWAHPLETMSFGWVGERVAVVDLERALRNIVLDRDDAAWGPDRTFRYPLRGGIGAIWRAVASLLPRDSVYYQTEVAAVDLSRRVVRTRDGRDYCYDYLISTLPLDLLTRMTGNWEWSRLAGLLKYTTVHVVGVGLAGAVPDRLRTKNWMYFPDPSVPFHRVTVFSNYSPYNVPDVTRYWSLLAEVSESRHKPVNRAGLAGEVLAGLRKASLVPEDAEVVSVWTHTVERGYPVPTLERDQVLKELMSGLESHGVYSRGRLGAWKYEVSSQDHSFMQGVELVDSLLLGVPEVTLHQPDYVNTGAARRLPKGTTPVRT